MFSSITVFILALAAVVHGALIYFFCCGSEDDSQYDDLPVASPPPSTSTPLLDPSSPYDSYIRGQTNTRIPTTYDRHQDHSNRSRTYASHSHHASSASYTTHTQPSYLGPEPPSSIRVQPSYLRQPSSSHIAQVAAKAKAIGENDLAYRSDLASSHPSSSRGTIRTSTHVHVANPPQLSPTRVCQTEVSASASTTVGYGSDVHCTGLASHHVAESGQAPSTPTRARAQLSYHQLQTESRVTEDTAKAQASPITTDYDAYRYRPNLASSRVGEGRETSVTPPPPPPLHISLPLQLDSTSVSRNTVSTTTTSDHANTIHYSDLFPPYSKETPPTGLASSTQTAHQRTHSPDIARLHVFEYPESRPTYFGTLSSSSGSGHLGPSSSTRVIPLSQSRVPNARSGVEFEASTTTEDMKAATELRERARRSNREMRVAFDLAKSARKRDDYAAAQRHRQDAIAHESEMKSLNKRAAKIIFRENKKASEKGTVDLHGLYVTEAMEYAKNELQSATYRNDDEICFVIGKGLHSDGGQSKLRPHLQSLCDERRLTYSLDPKNAGKLKVRLK